VSRRPVEIRRARPEDVEDILALWGQSLAETSPKPRAVLSEESAQRLHAVLSVDEPAGSVGGEFEVLVARVADRAVGFVVLRQTALTMITGATALCIDEFYVSAAERRHGVGRALLAQVAGQAERLGAEQIIAGVPPWSKDTQRYFARLGFAPVMVRRATTPSALRRRLAGADGQRGTLENLLSRRRSLRARSAPQGKTVGEQRTSLGRL
jgi:L-amino acid N-acyltransferase YncA